MAVYIHETMQSPGSKSSEQAARVFYPGREFSHLIADTEQELIAYAKKMHIPLAWIQHPGTWEVHFDLTGMFFKKIWADPSTVKLTLREWAKIMQQRRAATVETAPD